MRSSGLYLRVLREAQGISRRELARQLGVDHSQIERIERGVTDTRGSLLLAMVRALHGDANDVADLITGDDDDERARRMAAVRLDHNADDHAAEAQRLIDRLRRDAYRWHRWIAAGYALMHERDEV